MGLWNNFGFFDIFRKKSKKSHLVELKKLENNIQDQIGPCQSVCVRNRPQRDQFLQSFDGVFLPRDGRHRPRYDHNLTRISRGWCSKVEIRRLFYTYAFYQQFYSYQWLALWSIYGRLGGGISDLDSSNYSVKDACYIANQNKALHSSLRVLASAHANFQTNRRAFLSSANWRAGPTDYEYYIFKGNLRLS